MHRLRPVRGALPGRLHRHGAAASDHPQLALGYAAGAAAGRRRTGCCLMTAQIRIHDIPGGIHPPENKAQSTTRGVEQPPLPARLILPLLQHIRVPAEPVVTVGYHALEGQLLATAQGRCSCARHAPTSGTIAAIGPAPYPQVSGLHEPAIVLDCDGEDRWVELEPIADYRA